MHSERIGMTKEALLNAFKGRLIVSCQALTNEPLYTDQGGIMPLMAKAALQAGAVGIRANSARDVAQIKEVIPLPVIGLIKRNDPNYETYITPTMAEVDDLVAVGTDVIAIEFTSHTRENNETPSAFLQRIKQKYPTMLIMADCATLSDALAADKAGADFIGTTMSGYTDDSELTEGPNFELAEQIIRSCKSPLFAEGRIHYPYQAAKMIELGAHCVIVGGAITRPKEITERFVSALKTTEKKPLNSEID